MNKYIDFGEIETWPEMLKRLVFDHSEKVSQEKKAEWENIQSGKAHYQFIEMPIYDRVKSEIEEFLSGSTALAWHCTKLIHPNRVIQNGIRPFKVSFIKEIICSELNDFLGRNDQQRIIREIEEYEEDGFFESREKQIWFLLNKAMCSDTGCHEFFEFFGGEGLRRVIESELPEYVPIFQQVGAPYLIEFPVELSQISSYQLSNLADELIKFGIHTSTGEQRPRVFAEGKISRPVPTESILKTISI